MEVYWTEQTQADVPRGDDWLTPSEILRLNSMRIPKRHSDWRLGRWTAKLAVARFFELSNELQWLREIEIPSALGGAPEVCFANRRTDLAISLSHRSGVAACVLADKAVALGCDLEITEVHSDAFLADYFTAEEQALVTAAADRDLLLALLWSAKESALKALGTGLRADTRSVVAYIEKPYAGTDAWSRLKVRHISGRFFHGWWQQGGNLIRTLVAGPSPCPPVRYQEPKVESSHGQSPAVSLS